MKLLSLILIVFMTFISGCGSDYYEKYQELKREYEYLKREHEKLKAEYMRSRQAYKEMYK